MRRYENKSGNSNITAYYRGEDFIVVRFGDKMDYTYTYESASEEHVEEMKRLANEGQGLSAYISRNVRNDYSDKEEVSTDENPQQAPYYNRGAGNYIG